MLQEAFDLPSTQILSLYALGNYLATRPQLSVSDATAKKRKREKKTPALWLFILPKWVLSVWEEVVQWYGSLIE